MKIEEKISIADYYRHRRFRRKIPKGLAEKEIYQAGENTSRPLCSCPTSARDFALVRNKHHSEKHKSHDVAGRNVLIGTEFALWPQRTMDSATAPT